MQPIWRNSPAAEATVGTIWFPRPKLFHAHTYTRTHVCRLNQLFCVSCRSPIVPTVTRFFHVFTLQICFFSPFFFFFFFFFCNLFLPYMASYVALQEWWNGGVLVNISFSGDCFLSCNCLLFTHSVSMSSHTCCRALG